MSIFCSSVILLRIASTRCSTASGAEVAAGTSTAVIATNNRTKTAPILRCDGVACVRAGIIIRLLRFWRSKYLFRRIVRVACAALQFAKLSHFAIGVRGLSLFAVNAGEAKMRLCGKLSVFLEAQNMQPGTLGQGVVSIQCRGF